jgi:hypothetical protein
MMGPHSGQTEGRRGPSTQPFVERGFEANLTPSWVWLAEAAALAGCYNPGRRYFLLDVVTTTDASVHTQLQ